MKGIDTNKGPQNEVPLRTILRNFLNLVENYERKNGGTDTYDQEFQELKQFSEGLKTDTDYACKEGEKTVNRKKNRYKDILPFDYTRVILSDYGDIPGCNYINGNFIKGASGSSAYIACQGPLAHTVNDFWRMVVECEVQVIVMACNEQESGKHKCENYWVSEPGVERQFGQVTVWLKKSRDVCPDFLIRTMRIRFRNTRGDQEERNVCQFHYSAWPDHGVPSKVGPLLDMVRLIRDCQTSETLPVLVHCSAGCGRTGTICAIDFVWGLLRLGKLTPDFSLFSLVREMRRQRIAMVQTKDQYILVHRAVKELFQEQLKIIDAHPYANVDLNGFPLDIKAELEEPTYETIEFGEIERSSIEELCSSNDIHRIDHEIRPVESKESSSVENSPPEKPPKEEEKVKSSLLRKPSIVKLKALFEKSPKEGKKIGQLSRAKSDASSRFYSFASSFTRGSSEESEVPKLKMKPPILTKPKIPVKRSKSLKIHLDKLEEKSGFASGGFSHVENTPIKVCVKHMEIPQVQSVVASSVRPEVFTASTSRAVNEIYSTPRGTKVPVRMGVAKEMEDLGRKEEGGDESKRLTRSQSHVWAQNRVNLPMRIFSDENLATMPHDLQGTGLETNNVPVVRKRVPKTNPYVNYPMTPKREEGKNHRHGSVGNSSDSSSNTGTPRSSLPGTPTQSIDALFFQMNRGQKGPYKSILKESLTTTPSESDERLEGGMRQLPPFSPPYKPLLGGNPKLGALRVGMRERRNSFRQAVMKEDSPPTLSPIENGMIRSHKDYEPIWPDSIGKRGFGTGSLDKRLPPHYSRDQLPEPLEPMVRPPDLHNRVEEIKVLLEELKGPSSDSSGIRDQRSFRVSSRNHQQEQGPSLSCFSFKKPSSLESLTEPPPESNYSNIGSRSIAVRGPHGGRYANDYVSLNHCRSEESEGVFHVVKDEEFGENQTMPIPPPRTKKNVGKNGKIWEKESEPPLTVWNPDERKSSTSSETQPILSPTSPKAIIRALGLFQAKAANVRSRFANWSEAKERNANKNAQSSSTPSESKQHGIEVKSYMSYNGDSPIPGPSRPKHQYL